MPFCYDTHSLEVLDGDAVFMHQLEHDLVQEANTNGATWKTYVGELSCMHNRLQHLHCITTTYTGCTGCPHQQTPWLLVFGNCITTQTLGMVVPGAPIAMHHGARASQTAECCWTVMTHTPNIAKHAARYAFQLGMMMGMMIFTGLL